MLETRVKGEDTSSHTRSLPISPNSSRPQSWSEAALVVTPNMWFLPSQSQPTLSMSLMPGSGQVPCVFWQVGLDQQTVKLVCTNRRKQFLLDTADVALAE